MSEHTPGPWEAFNHQHAGWDITSTTGWIVDDCGVNGAANARLIAAAPELLAAIKALCVIRDDDLPFAFAEWKAARDAISKATTAK